MPVLTTETETRLRDLVDQLLATNAQYNLTSIRDPEEAWNKHILDSLQALELEAFAEAQTAVDVGAGAGFPGLPLAIALPRVRFSFIEATRKKCAFIEAMSERFGLKANVINGRAEDIGHDKRYRKQFDIATARAVGSLMEVAEYCLPLVKVNGQVILWRGKDAEAEAHAAEVPLDLLGGSLADVRPYELPGHELQYHLVVINKLDETPAAYPRRVGIPKSKPLTEKDVR
jgi:16S rRNA (guanine527-N7)-methyltransferase